MQTEKAMKAKILLSVTCVEAVMYLLITDCKLSEHITLLLINYKLKIISNSSFYCYVFEQNIKSFKLKEWNVQTISKVNQTIKTNKSIDLVFL